MRKTTVLELDRLAGSTLKEIKEKHPRLWTELERALVTRVKALVRLNRREASPELHGHLRRVNWSDIVQPGGDAKAKLIASFSPGWGGIVTPTPLSGS